MSVNLLLGSGGDTFRWGTANHDDGTAVLARLDSARVAPAGQQGEAVAMLNHLVLAGTGATDLRLTPIVDDVAYDGTTASDARVTLSTTATRQRTQQAFRLGLSQPFLVDGIELGRLGLRGTWFQYRLETTSAVGPDVGGSLGELLGEGMTVEYEPVGTSTPILAGA